MYLESGFTCTSMEENESSESDSYSECASCKVQCLRFCCCCCAKVNIAKDSKHPHILYGQLVERQDSKQTDTDTPSKSESSIQRSYRYPQKYREYSFPPELVQVREEEGVVIRQQPRATRSTTDVKKVRQFPRSAKSVPDMKALETIDSQSNQSYESMEDDTEIEVGYLDTIEGTSFGSIECSPKQSLERGEPIEFPGQRKKMSISCIRGLDSILLEKLKLKELQTVATPDVPGVYFSLSFDEHKSVLVVHISHVVDLPTQRPEETSNPYVQVYLLLTKSEIKQSNSIEGTHSPFFDQLFRFTNLPPNVLKNCAVVMRFYINVDHFIGGILYGLEGADLVGNRVIHSISQYDEEEGLKESCHGDILVTVSYHSRTSVLEILVLEVSNLKKQDVLRLPNPYVKINLLYRSRRVSKLKTATKKHTFNPIFNELFEFDFSSMNLEELQLDMVVMNYDRLGHNHMMGGVSFGDHVTHKSGQSHWNKIMIEANSDVTMWHPLMPLPSSSYSPSPSSSKKQVSAVPVGGQGCFTTGMKF